MNKMENFCKSCKKIGTFYYKQKICDNCCDELAGNTPSEELTSEEQYQKELENYLLYEGSYEELIYGEGCTIENLLAEGIDPY